MLKIIHMTVNGKETELAVDERESLLDTLRNRLGLTSVKKGCEVGECGACTVLVNGEAIDSCIYLTMWADGKSVMTVEGLKGPNGELSPIQKAFIEEAAVQCGFCTPGLIMSAVEIVGRCIWVKCFNAHFIHSFQVPDLLSRLFAYVPAFVSTPVYLTDLQKFRCLCCLLLI